MKTLKYRLALLTVQMFILFTLLLFGVAFELWQVIIICLSIEFGIGKQLYKFVNDK